MTASSGQSRWGSVDHHEAFCAATSTAGMTRSSEKRADGRMKLRAAFEISRKGLTRSSYSFVCPYSRVAVWYRPSYFLA